MTRDEATAALTPKGFYVSSCMKLGPGIGFMAASRPNKGPISAGEAGFGQTADLALRSLLDQHGARPPAPRVSIDADLAELLGL